MNFYASVAMRAELFPYSFVFQGPAVVRINGIRYFFVLNQTRTIYACFHLLRRRLTGPV